MAYLCHKIKYDKEYIIDKKENEDGIRKGHVFTGEVNYSTA